MAPARRNERSGPRTVAFGSMLGDLYGHTRAAIASTMSRVTRPAQFRIQLVALALAGLGAVACHPQPELLQPAPVPEAESAAESALEPRGPTVDSAAMMDSIAWLASDERRGRFTLDPEIETVAAWLGEHYAELGLVPAPGADGFRVGYSLRTHVEAGEHQRLVVHARRQVTVGAAQLLPRGQGIAGAAKGELVFVGYAASWTRAPSSDQPSSDQPGSDQRTPHPGELIDSYDDLAGVDLEGKVALVLANAPNTPEYKALFAAIQDIATAFETRAKALREQGEVEALRALHKGAREQLAELAAAFLDVGELGDEFWEVEDPLQPLDIMGLAAGMARDTQRRPLFDPGTNKLEAKLERLAAAGAVGVILVQGPRSFATKAAATAGLLPSVMGETADPEPPFKPHTPRRPSVIPNPVDLPVLQLRWTQADKLFRIDGRRLSKVQAAIDADYQPRSQPVGVTVELETSLEETRVEVPNVVAVLPGETDELVVLGAHFDHIGDGETGMCRVVVRRDSRDSICNGADDNGSGTAMLMELARAYTRAGLRPERTIVFTHFSGEELGLLGSSALAAAAPFDMDKVAAMVNLDMVGRLGPKGLAIGGISSSDDWMPLLDELGNYDMQILYEGSTTTRSDHAHWFRRQIPVLFFFTGVHADYHRAGDEIDEINVDGMASIGQLVSDLIWELGAGYPIAWGGLEPGEGIARGLPGTDPETVVKRVDASGATLTTGD